MKKIITLLTSLATLTAMQAASAFTVYQSNNSIDTPITDGQTITITKSTLDEWGSGKYKMEFMGKVVNNNSLMPLETSCKATRTTTATADDFCYGVCSTMSQLEETKSAKIAASGSVALEGHYTPTANGEHVVTYNITAGTESITFTVKFDYTSSSVKDNYAANAVYVANGQLYWNLGNDSSRRIVLSDLTGKRLITYAVRSANGSMDASQLNKGVYILSVYEEGKAVMNRKIVVK